MAPKPKEVSRGRSLQRRIWLVLIVILKITSGREGEGKGEGRGRPYVASPFSTVMQDLDFAVFLLLSKPCPNMLYNPYSSAFADILEGLIHDNLLL